jgi:hypothetical protein
MMMMVMMMTLSVHWKDKRHEKVAMVALQMLELGSSQPTSLVYISL